MERGVRFPSTGYAGTGEGSVFPALLNAAAELDLPQTSISLLNLSVVGQVQELVTT